MQRGAPGNGERCMQEPHWFKPTCHHLGPAASLRASPHPSIPWQRHAERPGLCPASWGQCDTGYDTVTKEKARRQATVTHQQQPLFSSGGREEMNSVDPWATHILDQAWQGQAGMLQGIYVPTPWHPAPAISAGLPSERLRNLPLGASLKPLGLSLTVFTFL